MLAIAFGVLSVLAGRYASLYWDLPSGPVIVGTAALFFALSHAWPRPRQASSAGAATGQAKR